MAPKIVCVVGPTACGKTTLGVLLAKKFNGEVFLMYLIDFTNLSQSQFLSIFKLIQMKNLN